MTETPFDAEAWIGHLGAALEALAATVEYSFSLGYCMQMKGDYIEKYPNRC